MRRWLPLLLAFGACAPFASDATSGGDHPETDASTTEASIDAKTGAVVPPTPAPLEGGLPDASGIVLAKPLCNGLAPPANSVICEDFENASLQPSWDGTPPGPYFLHFIDPVTHGGAARYTLAAKSQPWTDTGHARDAFQRNVNLNTSERHRVEIVFDLYLSMVPTNMDIEIAALNVGPIVGGPYNQHLNIVRTDGEDEGVADLEIGEFTGGTDEKSTIANMSTHAWHHIVFALESGKGSASTFEVTIDEAPAAFGTVGRDQEKVAVGTVTVTTGMTYAEDLTGTMDYFIDDIVISDTLK